MRAKCLKVNLGYKMAINQKKILLLPGDGLGPEVVGETKKVIARLKTILKDKTNA